MKHLNLFKTFRLILLVTLLAAVMAIPAVAQEPVDEGEFEAAIDHGRFLWNPARSNIAKGDGAVVTRLNIEQAEDVFGFQLTIAYDSNIVTFKKAEPGDLLPGVEGVDYKMFVTTTGGGSKACQAATNASFTVSVAYFNPAAFAINGSGSLLNITWSDAAGAPVAGVAQVCLDGATSSIVDSGAVADPGGIANTNTTITIDPTVKLKFLIGLEGGKGSNDVTMTTSVPIATDVSVNGGGGCVLNATGYCVYGGVAVAPYNININRHGYLDVNTTFATGQDGKSLFMVAGDLNGDNVVNIFDLTIIANLLGQTVGANPPANLSAADYTGPGYIPDSMIDIMDLVLVAKNYEATGPTSGNPPSGYPW